MAPIKFEEHIKEKLDKREIQPSAKSWEQLNSRLDASENRSERKWWIPAVAAVAVLLVVSLLFVDQQEQSTNTIVETPAEEKVMENSGGIGIEQPVQVASEVKKETREERVKKPETARNNFQQTEQIAVQNKNSEMVPEPGRIEKYPSSKRSIIKPLEIRKPEIVESASRSLNDKVQEVLARISQKEKNPEEYTEEEVDALLAEAVKEISKAQKLYNGGVVNANALLAEVEYEVDQSFRKEVFEFLKEEFLRAKTAVATRND